MDANSGEPWSETDIQDLRASLDFGNPFADAASMLCRDEDEVRQKAKELGPVERRKNGDEVGKGAATLVSVRRLVVVLRLNLLLLLDNSTRFLR
jgi:hypothetical protein